ncbi:hypothetical protein [Streptomyces sp. NPDC088261]|uniref:hypothetical protein n=1 Tax=Streptomyces sp. NPDC088261 TaxID=3365851 RepID=UPI0038261D09
MPRHATVLFLSTGLLLSGCSFSSGAPGDDVHAGPTLPARTFDADHWREGPAEPRQHQPYPYDLNTHCGIKWIHFGGRWWVLDSVFPGAEQVRGTPSSREIERVAGYVTLIGPDTAAFDAAGMPTMQFVPAEEEPPGCA